MALKDCIKKLGAAISAADRKLLEQYISDGLDDVAAVRKLLLGANKNVIDITERARGEGATVTPGKNALVSVLELQGRNLSKVLDEREKSADEIEGLNEEYANIGFVEDTVRADNEEYFDIHNDAEALDSLTRMFFRNPDLFKGEGIHGLKGRTPLALLKSFRALQERKAEIEARYLGIYAEQAALNERVDVIFGKGVTNPLLDMLRQDKRGSITFDEQNKALIRLNKARDMSTFLHESGHLYLQIFGDLAALPEAPAQTVADYAKILNYLGVSDRSEIGTEQHELWARSFEAYLREGVAPTPELQDIFSAFRSWLIRIYRTMARLNVELSDDIRGVMDRLVATDDAITEAERVQEFTPIYATAEQMGVSQEAFEVYRSNLDEAHREAVDTEWAKMTAAANRQAKTWWRDEAKKVRAEVTEELHGMRVYQALAMLQRGKNPDGSDTTMAPFKLSKESLLKGPAKGSTDFLKRLPGQGKSGIYSAKGGVDVDVAAQIFGYESGDAMIQEILRAAPMKALITAETAERMNERFPDPLVDGTLAADALVSVHNEKRAQILAAELRALRKQMRQDQKIVSATRRAAARTDREARLDAAGQIPNRGELSFIKQIAKIKIASMRIRDVNPNKYRLAEQKASRKAFKAMETKNYAVAYAEKLKQINAHEMFRAAQSAKDEAARTTKYLGKFERTRIRQKLGKSGMLHRILAVIEAIDLQKKSLAQVDHETALQELAQAAHDRRIVMSGKQANELYHVTIDDKGNEHVVLNRGFGTNWQDLTVEEFRGMRDIVRQLEHQAKTLAEAVVNDEKIIVDDAIDEISDSIIAGSRHIDIGVGEETGKAGRRRTLKGGAFNLLSAGSIARILDDADWGPVTRLLVVPIRRAMVEKIIPRIHKATEDVAALYTKHYSDAELADFSTKKPVPGWVEELSRSDILSIALHSGSDGNRQALLGGLKEDIHGNKSPAYTEQGVRSALATLDARDWAYVQDVWDYLNTYWAEASATEQRRRGIAPQKVEATPFTIRTSDGQEVSVRGGYMRLYYDPRHSDRTKAQEIDEIFRQVGNGVFVSANTRAGSTYERTLNHGKVVRLGLGAIEQHLHEVIRDISIGDEVNFIGRVLNSPKVRAALKHTNNQPALDQLTLWLTDSAVGELPAQDFWQKLAAYTRVGFTKSKLAFSSTVTVLQLTGAFQSMALIGIKPYMRGFGKFMQDPVGRYKWVMENSRFMHTRYGEMQQFSAEAAEAKSLIKSVFGPVPTKFKSRFEAFSHYFFWTIAKVQSVVDATTWYGAAWKAQNIEGLSNAEAILYADTLVEGAQTSGIFSDRSGFERGTLGNRVRQAQFVRLWATLLSYMLRKQGIFYEKAVKFRRDPSLANAAGFATDFMLLFVIEGIASQLIYGNWPGDDDDEIDALELARWTAVATADSIISGIPIVREVGTARYGSGNTPLGTVTKDIYDLMIQTGQMEIDEALIKTGVKVGGTLLHLPASQTNRIIEAAIADEAEFDEYIFGTREK